MVAGRVMLACTDCKRKMSGTARDVHRRSCESCSGQLVIVRYGGRRKKRR